MKIVMVTSVLAALLVAPGCIRVRSDPVEVEVKPIHVTVDVNLRVQRELDSFFGDIDNQDPSLKREAQ